MPRQAGVYLRISYDPTDTRLGVTRQRADCETKAKARGWTVAEVFEDNDVSASTGKRRPAYERMLQAIRDGRINAVVVWDLDRLTRRPIEVEHFIELADRHGVELATVGGDIDLATDNGWLYARIKGAVARNEVDQKSRRQRAANLQRRDMGVPHLARRSFGYATDRRATVPEEAAALRSAAAAVLAGESLASVTRALNAQGVWTSAGGPWHVTELRRCLLHPRYAGLMSYGGEPTGGRGTWPAILDEDTHTALRAALSDPGRSQPGRPHAYLLSGLAHCGACSQPVHGAWDKPRARGLYRCPSDRHISRAAADIDNYVTAVALERLGRPDALDLFTRPQRAGEARELQDEERSVRDRLKGLAEAFAEGDIDRAQMTVGTKRLNKRLGVLSAQLGAIVQQPDLSALISAEDIDAAWSGMALERRRAVIRGLLGSVVVHAAGRGARRFDPSTVEITWRESRLR